MPTSIVLSNIDAYLEDSRAPGSAGYIPPLALTPANGYVPQRFNPGFPEIRDVSERRPSQNGTFDFTNHFGARAVTLQVSIAHELQDNPAVTDQILEDGLKKWMLPNIRCFLYIRFNALESYRRIELRSVNAASPLAFITKTDFRSVSMSWRGINGVFEGAEEQTETLEPSSTVETGRAYDLTFDRTYPASDVIGAKILTNYGNAPSLPVILIYGPVTQPRIENQTTGKKLEFLAAYSLVAGEYLLIDFEEGTVSLNGDIANSRYDKLDFAGGISTWWELIPGDNSIRYYPLSYTAPSKAIVKWRSNYL